MENRDERSPVKDVAKFLREKVRDGTSFSEALKVASPNSTSFIATWSQPAR